jgi:hypothetical protein
VLFKGAEDRLGFGVMEGLAEPLEDRRRERIVTIMECEATQAQ